MEPATSATRHSQQTIIERPPTTSVVTLFKSVMAKSLATGVAAGATLAGLYAYLRPTITILQGYTLLTSATLVGSLTVGGSLALGFVIFTVKACCRCMQKKTKQVDRKSETEIKESKEANVQALRKLMAGSDQNKTEQVIDLIIDTKADCMSLDLTNKQDHDLAEEVSDLLKDAKGESRLAAIKLISKKYFGEAEADEKAQMASKLYAQVARFASLALFDLEMLDRCLYLIANKKVTLHNPKDRYSYLYDQLTKITKEQNEKSGKIYFMQARCYYSIGYYFWIANDENTNKRAVECFEQSSQFLKQAKGLSLHDNALQSKIRLFEGKLNLVLGRSKEPNDETQPGTAPSDKSPLEHKD